MAVTRIASDQRWQLAPEVALRPEAFGALAYHFGNRRLTFLKEPRFARLLRHLSPGTIDQAMTTAEVAESEREAFLEALSRLADSDMIRPAGSSSDG